MIWTKISYFFKRKYNQVERVLDFLPVIWKGYDFDYCYSLEVFKKQLDRQAKFLESNKAHTLEAKNNASKIRTAIRLMDKVYSGDYETEWVSIIEQQFGREALDWKFEDTNDGTGSSFITQKYEKWDNADEISRLKILLIQQSVDKQKRAENLLWKFIGHNLKYWWD